MPPVESCIKKLQWCLGTAARVVHVHGGEAQPAPLPPPLPPPPVALTAMPPPWRSAVQLASEQLAAAALAAATSTQPPTPAVGPLARRIAAVDEPQPGGERNAVAREHKVPRMPGAVDHHVIRPDRRHGDDGGARRRDDPLVSRAAAVLPWR